MPTLNSPYMFAEDVSLEDAKTRRWAIRNAKSPDLLGRVSWYGPWRQYCFYPSELAVFNGGCLKAIVDFLRDAMTEHRKAKR